ncbi:CU044_2847 family protein [Streptomyces sp. NPDC002785]|uniref:CU044_2847 family protein n=1 Tax=Streptomyces sp. NPDC002785 TaxID=3154543 RepID=UPI00331EF88D
MGDSGSRITRIEMPDGTPVWARISGAEELAKPARGPAFTDIGYGDFAEQVQARVESLQAVVTSVAHSLAEPLRAVRPDEVSVEFGIELTAKAGKVVGLLADGEAKGGIKVTLTWSGGGPPADPTVPAQTGARGTGQPPPQATAPSAVQTVPDSAAHAAGQTSPHPAPPMPPPPSSPPGHPPAPTAPPAAAPGASTGNPDAGASTGAPAQPDGAGPDAGSPS